MGRVLEWLNWNFDCFISCFDNINSFREIGDDAFSTVINKASVSIINFYICFISAKIDVAILYKILRSLSSDIDSILLENAISSIFLKFYQGQLFLYASEDPIGTYRIILSKVSLYIENASPHIAAFLPWL